jgi:hypothetical protein
MTHEAKIRNILSVYITLFVLLLNRNARITDYIIFFTVLHKKGKRSKYKVYSRDKAYLLPVFIRKKDSATLQSTQCTPLRLHQGCGSGLIQYGSGSSIFAQSGSGSSSGSGSKLKQNFRRQFFSQIFLKSKLSQIKSKIPVLFINFFSLKKLLVLFDIFLVVKFLFKNN